MEKAIAQHLAKTAFRSASMLAELVPFISEHCGDSGESKKLKAAIGMLVYQIDRDINGAIYESNPEVGDEIKSSIEKYGFVTR